MEDLEILAFELGYKTRTLPTTYLGLPLGMRCNVVSIWDGVEERFRRKLANWKRQYISKGGRLTLIRSTMSNLPIYIMSLFYLPKGVKERLEKIQREFLCVGGDLEKKFRLINGNTVCSSKERDSLGSRDLSLVNKALLGKWVWRFVEEKSSYWKMSLA